MAEIRFTCPGCNQTLEAPPEMAGQGVECPTCKMQMTVPEPEAPAAGGKLPTSNALASAMADAMTSADKETDAPPTAPGSGNVCPECHAGMEGDAVLCLQCGFHTKLGKKISTDLA